MNMNANKVPDHDIHVSDNGKGSGYLYEVNFENEVGVFAVSADDLLTCEQNFRRQYRKGLKSAGERIAPRPEEIRYEASVDTAARAADAGEGAGGAKAAEADGIKAETEDMGNVRFIRVDITPESLPRDVGSLAKMFFDVIYAHDPDMKPEEMDRDRDLVNLFVVNGNEDRAMTFLDSEEIGSACTELAINGDAAVSDRIEMILQKMKCVAAAVYNIRRGIQKDMKEKYSVLDDKDLDAMFNGTAGTPYLLMFAIALYAGIDISQPRQILIHKRYVCTTTDMEERDESRMHRYAIADNLYGLIDGSAAEPLGVLKNANGDEVEHCIGLTIGNPEELEGILSKHCPGHTLKDLYATFWVRGLD